MGLNLTPLEIAQLRLKCIEPWIAIATRQSIEGKDTVVFKRAEESWKFAIAAIDGTAKETTEPQPQS